MNSAFVPTSDEFYLSHAIDEYREVAKQAYLFELGSDVDSTSFRAFTLRKAELDDALFIEANSGDFFNDLSANIQAGETFLTIRDGDCVGFGIRVASRFLEDVSSIGMFTIEQFRGSGVGTATIGLLIELCRYENIRPVAGCWYYNHASKKTLLRAGMVAPARLLRIEY